MNWRPGGWSEQPHVQQYWSVHTLPNCRCQYCLQQKSLLEAFENGADAMLGALRRAEESYRGIIPPLKEGEFLIKGGGDKFGTWVFIPDEPASPN